CTVGHNTGVTSMTRQPVSCPVCGRLITEPLLENFHISAQGDGMVHDVNAMKAFYCQEKATFSSSARRISKPPTLSAPALKLKTPVTPVTDDVCSLQHPCTNLE